MRKNARVKDGARSGRGHVRDVRRIHRPELRAGRRRAGRRRKQRHRSVDSKRKAFQFPFKAKGRGIVRVFRVCEPSPRKRAAALAAADADPGGCVDTHLGGCVRFVAELAEHKGTQRLSLFCVPRNTLRFTNHARRRSPEPASTGACRGARVARTDGPRTATWVVLVAAPAIKSNMLQPQNTPSAAPHRLPTLLHTRGQRAHAAFLYHDKS